MDRDKLLATTALFRGSKPEEIAAMLGCLACARANTAPASASTAWET